MIMGDFSYYQESYVLVTLSNFSLKWWRLVGGVDNVCGCLKVCPFWGFLKKGVNSVNVDMRRIKSTSLKKVNYYLYCLNTP